MRNGVDIEFLFIFRTNSIFVSIFISIFICILFIYDFPLACIAVAVDARVQHLLLRTE